MIRVYLTEYYQDNTAKYSDYIKAKAVLEEWIHSRGAVTEWGILMLRPNVSECVYFQDREDALAFIWQFKIERYLEDE